MISPKICEKNKHTVINWSKEIEHHIITCIKDKITHQKD